MKTTWQNNWLCALGAFSNEIFQFFLEVSVCEHLSQENGRNKN